MKRCSSRFLCSLFLLMTVTPSSTQTVKFSRHDYPANSGPFSVTATDVNGDGFADLLVGNTIFQQGVTVLLNNHDGTFTPPIESISHDQSADIVAIADMNGDGKPDVVFVDRFHFSISVMYGNGDGTFQLPVRAFFGGPNPNSLALADFNGDGRVDIVWAREGGAATASPPALRMMLNTGNDAQGHAQFAAPVDLLTSTDSTQNFFSVTTGDLNGDGKPDLAFLICCSSNPATPVIATEAFGHA
ncbi:MAG TPA: VCBS repeat-containing protein, partial [Candidatus Sulfotelmatobacter sp.]|nr:VCBS repeat-containing protein [Candidatus Sulfotelmatobacter sp.]